MDGGASTGPFSPKPNAALVLVGHGSTKNTGSSASTRAHADAIRAEGLFKSVHVGFLKEEPLLDGLLDTIDADEIFVVPNMASRGYLTNDLIPATLKLTGAVTERIGPQGRTRIHLCDPVGTHPALLDAMAQTVRQIALTHALGADDTAVLVCGHGNPRNPENARQTERGAARIREAGAAHEIKTAYLEEAPYIRDWKSVVSSPNLIVMPFLTSGGLHGAEDIPNLLGISPDDDGLTALDAGAAAAGPYSLNGRTVWYCRPIGTDPIVTDVILSRVASAAAAQ